MKHILVNICKCFSEAVPSHLVAISHMWLFKFKLWLIKFNKIKNSLLQLYQQCFKCSVATQGYHIGQQIENMSIITESSLNCTLLEYKQSCWSTGSTVFSFNRQWQIALQNDSSTFIPAMNASTNFVPLTSKLIIMGLKLFC